MIRFLQPDSGSRMRIGVLIIGVAIVLALVNAVSCLLLSLMVLAGMGFAVMLAVCAPLLTLAIYLLVSVFPLLLATTPIYDEGFGAIGGGLLATDVVLLVMAGATLFRLVTETRLQQRIWSGMGILVGLFAAWLLFEILRNYAVYGLSAPGEFRFRYLILVAPFYVAVSFDTLERRRLAFKLLLAASLLIPLMAILLIGNLKGWQIGPSSRFLTASLSLGLVYGLLGLYLAQKYGAISIIPVLLQAAALAVLFIVLADSHRSVWVVSTTVLLLLLILREIHLRQSAPLVLLLASFFTVGIYLAVNSRIDLDALLISRATEIFTPQAQDGTASWRLEQWDYQMQKFYASPWTGIGFGGYWGEGRVAPHSLYVQTLVKLGGVGLLFYLAIVLQIGVAFWRRLQEQRDSPSPDNAIVISAFVVLIAAHAYYTVYSFEAYSWLFIGLGLAVLIPEETSDEEPTYEVPMPLWYSPDGGHNDRATAPALQENTPVVER